MMKYNRYDVSKNGSSAVYSVHFNMKIFFTVIAQNSLKNFLINHAKYTSVK